MDALLAAFLADFPDDEACTLLATLRDAGAIVRDGYPREGFEFWTVIKGHTYRGRGATDVDAARALILAVGYDPR